MDIDYAILGVLSVAMVIYAYLARPDNAPPTDDDDDGGIPHDRGDSSPTGRTPTIQTRDTEDERSTVPA